MRKNFNLLWVAFVSVLSLICSVASHAQTFPSKPIHILIGYGPGGGIDGPARLYGSKLQTILNTAVVVDNKPGASELLAAQPVMYAAPDGYTLWIGSGAALAQGPGVRSDLPYDVRKNFTPISLIGEGQAVLIVRNGIPVNNLAELIEYAKKNPNKLNYGSAGVGSGNHLHVEYMMQLTGGRNDTCSI